jgi:uncharacterized protein YecT (DUF1311 family)
MKNINFYSIISLFLLFCTFGVAASSASPTPEILFVSLVQQAEECDLTKVPLTKCDLYNDYKIADLDLNRSYQNLAKTIPKLSLVVLRKTQREWIKFRDDKCEDMQLNSGCDNSLCTGVAHDECILELTNERIKELSYFFNYPERGVALKYAFNKRYPKGKQY